LCLHGGWFNDDDYRNEPEPVFTSDEQNKSKNISEGNKNMFTKKKNCDIMTMDDEEEWITISGANVEIGENGE